MIKLEKILMSTDFSSSSENAMRYAVSFAQEYDAELIVLHVIHESHHLRRGRHELPQKELDKSRADETRAVQLAINGFIEDIDENITVRSVIKTGIPTVEIVELAKAEYVDLIVMGTHGRTGTKHALIGSVAERVVRNAHCPVFTVKPLDFTFEIPYDVEGQEG